MLRGRSSVTRAHARWRTSTAASAICSIPACAGAARKATPSTGANIGTTLLHAMRCRASLESVFGDHDVLVAPAATGEAPKGLASTGDTAMNVVWTLLQDRKSVV